MAAAGGNTGNLHPLGAQAVGQVSDICARTARYRLPHLLYHHGHAHIIRRLKSALSGLFSG